MKENPKEADIAAYLIKRLKDYGGHARKVSWEGRADAPDYLIMACGYSAFVETKAPGKKPRPSQLREFELMEKSGGTVVYVVTTELEVDTLVNSFRFPALSPKMAKLDYKRFMEDGK